MKEVSRITAARDSIEGRSGVASRSSDRVALHADRTLVIKNHISTLCWIATIDGKRIESHVGIVTQ